MFQRVSSCLLIAAMLAGLTVRASTAGVGLTARVELVAPGEQGLTPEKLQALNDSLKHAGLDGKFVTRGPLAVLELSDSSQARLERMLALVAEACRANGLAERVVVQGGDEPAAMTPARSADTLLDRPDRQKFQEAAVSDIAGERAVGIELLSVLSAVSADCTAQSAAPCHSERGPPI